MDPKTIILITGTQKVHLIVENLQACFDLKADLGVGVILTWRSRAVVSCSLRNPMITGG